MDNVIRTKIVKVGNSYGIRIPKLLLEQLGFGSEVELAVQGKELVLRPAHEPRAGWEEQFRLMAERGDDALLDPEILSTTSWDDDEWQW